MSKVFVKDLAALASKRWFDSWTVLPGLFSVQTISVHIIHIFCDFVQGYDVVSKVPAHTFIPTVRQVAGPLRSMHLKTFPPLYMSFQGVIVRNSTFPHPDFGLSVFFAPIIGKGMVIVYPYGSLVCKLDQRAVQKKDVRGVSDAGGFRQVGEVA